MMRSLLATVAAATAIAVVAAPAAAHRTPRSDAVSAWNANAREGRSRGMHLPR